MIFEQAYGAWLVKEMNRRIRKFDEDLICKRYDDVAYKPLAGDPNSVAVIVTGGNAQRSSVRGLDYNVLPLSVMVMCREQCSTVVRNAIDAIQEEYNAVPLILDYYDSAVAAESRSAKDNYESNVRTNVKSTFTTPFMLLENDYKTTNETIKACFISFFRFRNIWKVGNRRSAYVGSFDRRKGVCDRAYSRLYIFRPTVIRYFIAAGLRTCTTDEVVPGECLFFYCLQDGRRRIAGDLLQ